MSCPHALKHDVQAGLWRSEHPALSAALLSLPAQALGVRPPGQPLPQHLQGSLLGRQFERWLRHRDDQGRVLPKAALQRALAELPAPLLVAHAQQQAALAIAGGWDHWIWSLAAASMASLLGLAPRQLAAQQRLHQQLRALAQALAADASAAQVARADQACVELLLQLRTADATAPLQQALARHAPPALWSDLWGDEDKDAQECFEANRLALLWQSYEAGAALLGNALAALAEQPALRRPGQMRAWLPSLVRTGGAVLNTRRFAQTELPQAGDAPALPAGSLLLLDLSGGVEESDALGFGAGAHRCPGQGLALDLTAAALEWLLSTRPAWPRPRDVLRLPNAHIPSFAPPPAQECSP